MHEILVRKLAMNWKRKGLSYSAIAKRLSISRDAACNLCVYALKTNKMKREPKLKMGKASTLCVKRKISWRNWRKDKFSEIN